VLIHRTPRSYFEGRSGNVREPRRAPPCRATDAPARDTSDGRGHHSPASPPFHIRVPYDDMPLFVRSFLETSTICAGVVDSHRHEQNSRSMVSRGNTALAPAQRGGGAVEQLKNLGPHKPRNSLRRAAWAKMGMRLRSLWIHSRNSARPLSKAENDHSLPVRPCQGSGPGSRPAATSASRSR
jgi:hypothetical protein